MSDERSWTVLELLTWTTQHFAERGIDTARLDAECLLAHVLGGRRLDLYIQYEKPVTLEERNTYRELVRRRGQDRVPVSQLLGEKEFWSLPFKVSCDVLTPRPDTETLVSWAIDQMPDPDAEYRVLDVGTGSGAIALAIAQERPKARVIATDISPAALQIAAENAEKLHLIDRVRLVEGDLIDPVREERFDVVVSNPPYVARRDAALLDPELAFEPEIALFGGEDGLEVLRPLLMQAGAVLENGGAIAVEIDPRQAETVSVIAADAGFEKIEVLRDLARRQRVVSAKKP